MEKIGRINNNKSELKMAESKQFDQNETTQRITSTNELSHGSMIQSDVSAHTCIEHVVESFDTVTSVLKEPINPDLD